MMTELPLPQSVKITAVQNVKMPCSVLVVAADGAGRPPLMSHSSDTPAGVDYTYRLVQGSPAAAAEPPTRTPPHTAAGGEIGESPSRSIGR